MITPKRKPNVVIAKVKVPPKKVVKATPGGKLFQKRSDELARALNGNFSQ